MMMSCYACCIFCMLMFLADVKSNGFSGSGSGSESGSGIEGSGFPDLSKPMCGGRVDLVFVVQGSSEDGSENNYNLRDAVAQVMSFFAFESTDGFCVWVIVYGAKSRVEILEICERNSAISQANFLSFPDESGSSVGEAVQLMRGQFMMSSRTNSSSKLAVIISSTPPDDTNKLTGEITLARNEGVRIIAIAIGGQVNDIFPSIDVDRYIYQESYLALSANSFEVQNSVCDLPDYCSTSTSVLVPNPRDSSSFLACLRLAPPLPVYVMMPCPIGLFFNPRIGVCDFPWVSRSLVDPCFENEYGEIPAGGGCSRFWRCRDGRTLDGGCCPVGERFVNGLGCITDASCTTNCVTSTAVLVPLTPEPGCDRSAINGFPDWFLEAGQLNTCDYLEEFDSSLCECTKPVL